MKKSILIFLLIPIFVQSQVKFVNTDFEKQDTTGKSILTWNYRCYNSEINLDSTVSFSNKNSLYINSHNRDRKEGCTVYTILPKKYNANLKSINISVRIRFPYDRQTGGFWVFAYKNNRILDGSSTYPYQLPFPLVISKIYKGMNLPISPWDWNIYNIEIPLNEEPDEIMIGFYVSSDNIWFDDLKISINEKIINDFVFQISK
jgi:hypothetical protein